MASLEVKSFVTGLQRDYDAVPAAVQARRSNCQVEGQVHRLKLLKRQMYGRSGFLLLRRPVLISTPALSVTSAKRATFQLSTERRLPNLLFP
jgi:hypothetical protein